MGQIKIKGYHKVEDAFISDKPDDKGRLLRVGFVRFKSPSKREITNSLVELTRTSPEILTGFLLHERSKEISKTVLKQLSNENQKTLERIIYFLPEDKFFLPGQNYLQLSVDFFSTAPPRYSGSSQLDLKLSEWNLPNNLESLRPDQILIDGTYPKSKELEKYLLNIISDNLSNGEILSIPDSSKYLVHRFTRKSFMEYVRAGTINQVMRELTEYRKQFGIESN